MNQPEVNYWSWTAFIPPSGAANTLGLNASANVSRAADVFLHFFPSALGVSAPYPVKAKVELFANGRVLMQQAFDGLKLNQPDGLDLARLFPVLSEQGFLASLSGSTNGGLVGLNMSLGTEQTRVDLSLSKITVELAYPSHKVRFSAARSFNINKQNLSRSPVVTASAAKNTSTNKVSGSEVQTEEELLNIFPVQNFKTKLVEIDPNYMPASSVNITSANVAGSADIVNHNLSTAVTKMDEDVAVNKEAAQVTPKFNSVGLSLVQREVNGSTVVIGSKTMSNVQNDAANIRPLVRYMAHYETTTNLPISVRCL